MSHIYLQHLFSLAAPAAYITNKLSDKSVRSHGVCRVFVAHLSVDWRPVDTCDILTVVAIQTAHCHVEYCN